MKIWYDTEFIEDGRTAPSPKCTRLIVTAIFADGTSTMVDVPEPADATMNFSRRPEPLPLDFYIMALVPETTEFVLRAKLSRHGARAFVVPAEG